MPSGVYQRKLRPWQDRLWAKIERRGPDDCWFWTGSLDANGYGRLNIEKVPELAHRFAYLDATGENPEGQCVLHKCESRYPKGDYSHRRCCNPAHLKTGTMEENSADAKDSGRAAAPPVNLGSAHGNSKLTEQQVVEIRLRYAAGGCTQKGLAAEFGVNQALVGRIILRKIWKHV
jgi:hypothetical protein